MHRRIVVTLAVLALSASGIAGCKKESPQKTEAPQTAPAPAVPKGTAEKTGEQLYKQYCAACHPDGGNTINPKKTLHGKELAENKITTPEDIAKVMRNPGPGMNKFYEATIPDKDAKLIGDYVLTTFRRLTKD
jgi:cytochrome c6